MPDDISSSLGAFIFTLGPLFFMSDRFPKNLSLMTALCLVANALTGCAVRLPPASASNPADPGAPAAATAPLRPTLLATSRTYLSPHADDREEKAKKMDMSQMKNGTMPRDSAGMSHEGHDMSGMTSAQPAKPAAPAPGAVAYYTCPMHREVHESKPGECPECGMTLIKKTGAPEGARP